jgi:hypothetical protein
MVASEAPLICCKDLDSYNKVFNQNEYPLCGFLPVMGLLVPAPQTLSFSVMVLRARSTPFDQICLIGFFQLLLQILKLILISLNLSSPLHCL